MGYLIFRTPLGLALRMSGENPHAAEAQGVDPIKIRYGAIIAGSALMAVGGAFLTLVGLQQLLPDHGAGARLDFHRARRLRLLAAGPGPVRRAALCLLRCLPAAGCRRCSAGYVPYQLFLMTPYILSIAALAVMARRARVPQALMQPYRRGERWLPSFTSVIRPVPPCST